MNIKDLKIEGFAALAPMAGVADRAMREICMDFGAAFCVGELASAKGIAMKDKKSAELLYVGKKERPMATLDTIKNILNENLDIDPETVGEESTFESLGIDSLDMVELICDLEEACEVDFGEPENLETVGDLVKYVDSL